MFLRCASTSLFSLASDAGAGAAPTPCYVVRAEASPFLATHTSVLCGGTNGAARLLGVGADGTLAALATLPGAPVPTAAAGARGGAQPVCDVAFADAHTAAVCLETGRTTLWDLRAHPGTVAPTPACVLGNTQRAQAMCANRDGHTLAVACGERLCLWDARQPARALAVYRDIHTDDVTCLCFARSHPRTLVSGSMDALVCATDTSQAPDDDDSSSAAAAAAAGHGGDDDDMEDGEYGELLDAVLSVEHPVERIEFLGDDDTHLSVITCDECVSLWSLPTVCVPFPIHLLLVVAVVVVVTAPAHFFVSSSPPPSSQSERLADYGDPRERLLGPDGVPMNHVVAVKRDRATGADLLVATTGAGALGLFVLRGRDIVPLVATAPAGTAPVPAGHSDLVRCAALCNSFVVTGAEDSRVCAWTATPLPPADAAPAPVPQEAAAAPGGQPYGNRADSRGHARKQRSAMSPY